MPGYSIDWLPNKNNINTTVNDSLISNKISCPVATHTSYLKTKNIHKMTNYGNYLQLETMKLRNKDNNAQKYSRVRVEKISIYTFASYKSNKVTAISLNDTVRDQSQKRTVLPKAKASLTFSLLAWVIVVVFVFAILFLIPLSTLLFFLILAVGGVFDILGFIFGIIAIHTYKKEPSKYFGLNWAILGIVFSAIILTIIIVLFTLLK